jgi:DNA-binding transcriptional regulator LsrR (DeoR family)
MNNLSTEGNMNSSLEWRRSKVQELASQGYNQSEISRILQISQPTINRDITFLRQQAKENIKKYIDERLPEEYEKCLVGLTAITRECYSMKLEQLTNASVVDDAIRFVSSGKSK